MSTKNSNSLFMNNSLVSERKGFFNHEGLKIMKKILIEKLFVFQLHRSDIYVVQCVSVG